MIHCDNIQARAALRLPVLICLLVALAPGLAGAQQATLDTQIGDTVTHPVTGEQATVVDILPNYAVLTDNDDVIIIWTMDGEVFTPNDHDHPVTIISSTINPDTGLVDTITIDPNDPDNPPDPLEDPITLDIARDVNPELTAAAADAAGAAGQSGGDIPVIIPAGNVNVYALRRDGDDGDDGDDGFSFQICDPFGLLGCATIEFFGETGEAGAPGPTLVRTIGASNGDIQSITDRLDGIAVESRGGDGGQGGDAVGNTAGWRGGNAGRGGTVDVTSTVSIATSGDDAHGVFGLSRSGSSGPGGDGWIFAGGGDGGAPANGGNAGLTNDGAINTLGNGSHGMYALSSGGIAGGGGDSWGLVGSGGSSLLGGNGGAASVTNNGTIVTEGDGSHGMVAQSIGGTGGDGGNAGALIAFGGAGSAGGNGGNANASLGAAAQVVTTGDQSIGVLVQSIGGGGGNGGVSGGVVVAFGGTGSAGGDGGTVDFAADIGSTIATRGDSAHAVLAQSIGGGGGVGASAGGIVALGGDGSAGGDGGQVDVDSAANITTDGDNARGLFAQSIGGGGGAANASGGVVSLGGNGSSGGDGGAVDVNNSGTIVTHGVGSDAIYAQSVGGGGGAGAASGGVVSIGGAGNSGGEANTVTVTNSGTLATGDDSARGIFVQSIAGGGGSGGASYALISIGGAGSDTSDANSVAITNNGSISTAGVNASAIQAQSIGGGGGDGGTTGGVLLTVGGRGGGGGQGSAVNVESNRSLLTTGDDSHGIFAQGIGGGGGNGGNGASGSLFAGVAIGGGGGLGGDAGEEDVTSVTVTTNSYDTIIGGETVTLAPTIRTSGDRAHGILAQSVGGGGGNGGFAVQTTGGTFLSAAIGIGGSGANGGLGRRVLVDSTASIVTEGDDSDGLVAQSIGGGGGNGGFAIAGSLQANPTGGGAVSVAIGGSGGAGNHAGEAEVDFSGSIQTSGERADGLVVQSLGGGGGNGGFSVAGSLSLGGVGSGAVAVGLGGSGNVGGNGNTVTAASNGTIITRGDDATAVLYQSVGGGGGNGGYNVAAAVSGGGVGSASVGVGIAGSGAGGGTGGEVDGRVSGRVGTSGDRSGAVTIQSVGGGGGNGGFNISVAGSGAVGGSGAVSVGLGGAGAAGSDGGTVTANTVADVGTEGDQAHGVLVQSIGGGGGNGGFNVSAAVSGAGTGSGAVGVGIGGSGAGGGDGGVVTATLAGDVSTGGEQSSGVIAQSVGGGGGNGAFNVAGTVSVAGAANFGASVGLGGSAGTGGHGERVTASQSGNVATAGAQSTGVLFQSLGGGGGNGGVNVSGTLTGATGGSGAAAVGIGGSGGGGGAGNIVDGTVTGDVMTAGDEAFGIVVQSIGGGGGNGGLNVSGAVNLSTTAGGAAGVGIGGFGGIGGNAAEVISHTTGDLLTTGARSAGYVAQSLGGGGGNGALNVSGAVSVAPTGGGSLAVGVGGFGGGGGNAGNVTSVLSGDFLTAGPDSGGILLQSQAGGGGNGSLNVSAGLNLSMTGGAGAFGVGGFGGNGGFSGNVSLTHTGDVFTAGARSDAVTATSIGGGGGNGGLNVSGGVSATTVGSSLAVAMGIGGFGGSGGEAGDVTVNLDGSVVASGLAADEIVAFPDFGDATGLLVNATQMRLRSGGSHGVFAQSAGGSGGNGALNVSGGISLGAPAVANAYALTLGLGGFGGGGGAAGDVTVDVVGGGLVSAIGDDKSGITAQSFGGGGGNGSLNVSGGIALDGVVTVGVGGFGGDGGAAGNVTVTTATDVSAGGHHGVGLLAQSIGGGGGNGGINISGGIAPKTIGGAPSLVFGVGGFGGDGDIAGNVNVTHAGNVATDGIGAHGIVAQSIGGGGGNGALNVAGNLSGQSRMTVAGGVGGFGGEGTDAGIVTVMSDGSIFADGAGEEGLLSGGAKGIVAQSIGGGGGNGGMNVSGIFVANGSPIVVGVGGYGDGGGNASSVTVRHGLQSAGSGIINTTGDYSAGIFAQSIGGGGGDAGVNFQGALNMTAAPGGSGGSGNRCSGFDPRLSAAACNNWANVVAELQSRQRDGGATQTATTVQIGIGGRGGAAGEAAATTVEHAGDILTAGDYSEGILAQSIGGGGGNAAVNLGLALASSGYGVNLGIGGAPGDGGTGSSVLIDHRGDITTYGIDSAGIHAQSIGGGGGNTAMNTVTGKTPNAGGKFNVSLGRMGGSGGSGGEVTLTSDGTVTTFGDESIGLLAQSVGNGGGKSGSTSIGGATSNASVNIAFGLEGGEGGTSGEVTVTALGRVQTEGSASHAIVAQSIGGGGGIGGMALTPAVLTSTAAMTFGGEGGEGGTSGLVDVDNFAELLTLGEGAIGVFAQSIGGGGGNGGMAVTAGLQSGGGGALMTMGGSGGEGAVGGGVILDNDGIIDTRGNESHGVFAQSIGGGGGNGGMTINGLMTAASSLSTNLSVTIGGNGGTGAIAGATTVTNRGTVLTAGDDAMGLFAQSIGGGGGNGGLVSNTTSSVRGSATQIGLSFGGSGGTGAAGGAVGVDNVGADDDAAAGAILTTGTGSHGILAQSIGGGGGNGSSVITRNSSDGSGSLQVGMAFGGDGGTGGTGGPVTVTNSGMIETQGDGAHGIFAESVGGGGGHGGIAIATNEVDDSPSETSSIRVVVGGSGGNGNDGGTVVVSNSGSVLTSGAGAHGILAQSVGGGGGDATLTLMGTDDADTLSRILRGVIVSTLGGTGGTGGLGGDVVVNHSGDITTLGAGSEAIVVQSINGGGGGLRVALSDVGGNEWVADEPQIAYRLGSTDVNDAAGGTATANTSGTINTRGADAVGQAVQSVGGGGGVLRFDAELVADENADAMPVELRMGGSGGQNNAGGDIFSDHTGDTGSTGAGAHGAYVQSVGGGGGRGIVNLSLAAGRAANLDMTLGSADGETGGGGDVGYDRDGNIVTTGDRAVGTLVQSIGGGGGTLAANVDEAGQSEPDDGDLGMPEGSAQRSALLVAQPAVASISLGASSGNSLQGGDLSLALTGDLATTGHLAQGLILQSIGAGGGFAQYSGTSGALSVTLGSSAGATGNGGSIGVTNTGNLWTSGNRAHGVLLQSIGGGGGAVFTNLVAADVDVSLADAGNGDGGAILFTQTGDIRVEGDGAYGLFVQSLGGGGGVVDGLFAGTAGGSGTGGTIDLTINGSVMALADGASAVLAQSEGGNGGGDIWISLPGDHVVLGGAGGIGIELAGGNHNEIINHGLIATLDNFDGTAIAVREGPVAGNDFIRNFGTMTGSIRLGAGENALRNEADAALFAGADLNLGADGTLFNFGALLPGGMDAVTETQVSGQFAQGDEGVFMADLDLSRRNEGPQADMLTISGNALLAGEIEMRLANPGFVLPGRHSDAIIATQGGVGAFEGMIDTWTAAGTIGTTPSLTLDGVPDSAVASFELVTVNGTDLRLESHIDFAPDRLNSNQSALGEHINRIQLAGGDQRFATMAETLFFTPTTGELRDIYDTLSPAVYTDALSHSLLSNTQFGEALLSCRLGSAPADDGQCRWMRFGRRFLDRDATVDGMGLEQDGIELSGGFQQQIGEGRHLGFGLSFTRSDALTGGRARGESDLVQAGAVFRRQDGNLNLSASLAAGHGWFDTARVVDLPSPMRGIATASPGVSFAAVHGRIGYDIGGEHGYLRPMLDVGVNYLHMGGFAENGVGAVSLQIPSMTDSFLSFHPAIEAGAELAASEQTSVRIYARAGVLHLGMRTPPTVSAAFRGAPNGVTTFDAASSMDRNYGDVVFGVDVLKNRQSLIRLEGNGLFGSNTRTWGVEAIWSVSFD